ncbi:bifunctional glycoside hydrolase 114/ polysaccharide deacetylase family protein [Noviherbaspirillum pedocola]|uniref:Bifunctional glycoside hydrolase 114/ polysaccharide deacetylase family protein n=1 Tax=Noviherbaspirillum pedocola TaxID=2801341 RepID=A0A934SYV0_9BURK|nr:bifunctional glycoside hydrolase 114/ polysaccharide deacetylase family protein [Noviherbaspirillum pedocola]MBK4738232.1 bifunctional glycoside hydrolase 114/ polysaccharide deacetylase family protein [Noviherbaspirillum pedocola]
MLNLLFRALCLTCLLLAGMRASMAQPAITSAPRPTVAFYYGDHPPLAELAAFDIAVVEPAHVADPRRSARNAAGASHQLFAYVSVGEVRADRPYYARLPKGSLRGGNAAWGSRVIDQTAPGWRDFFLDAIVAPLWQAGWRGFFLDTLDSYGLFAKTDAERRAQTDALVALITEFKRRYPDARLMTNRGFELLPRVASLIDAVAAESLVAGYDAASDSYRPVPQADHDWLAAQLRTVRDTYHLPAVAIDYVDPAAPHARDAARETARRIRADGFIPWVADGGLASMGVGAIEVLPRRALLITDSYGLDLARTGAQRFLGIQLNYLGLAYDIVDLSKEALPEGILEGRYAGIVAWFRAGTSHPEFAPWLARQTARGMRAAVFGNFALPPGADLPPSLGLAQEATDGARLTIATRDAAIMGFEAPVLPDRSAVIPLRLADDSGGRSLLRLTDADKHYFDAAAFTAWGGYVLAPFTVLELDAIESQRWVVEPMRFLRSALALQALPVPDVTTEGGRRMLMSHVDGDGFASRAEIPGAPFASEVMLKEFLERYRLPTTVSVIEGELSASGVYPASSQATEAIARRIFALPQVEPASHSYSHPFDWAQALADRGPTYRLKVPGYTLDLQRELRGSADYINRLLPPGKRTDIFFWTGDCVPPAEAIAASWREGLLNLNGGDTLITRSRNSWTEIAGQGVRKEGWYQVFAPHQNENVYTNNWTGPFYGFERVIETYQLTGEPYRFKPIDIYYHVYSASKPGSIAALHRIYDWASAQPTTRVYASQYIRKVLDFEDATIARDIASGELIVRAGADLRTLRLAPDAPLPDLAKSQGLAGFTAGPNARYLTLAAGEVRLAPPVAKGQPAALPYIAEANGAIADLRRSADGRELRFALAANGPGLLAIAGKSCSLDIDGKPLAPTPISGRFVTAAKDSDANPIDHYEFGAPNTVQATRYLARIRCAQ